MANRTIDYIVRDGALHPYAPVDQALFSERFGDGEIVQHDVHPLQRLFWKICVSAIREREGLPWDTAEELADALKRAAGHVTTGQTLAGKPYLFARSMGEMGDFPAYFDKMIDALANYLGVDRQTLTGPFPNVNGQEGSPAAESLIPQGAVGDQPSETPVVQSDREGPAGDDRAHTEAGGVADSDYSPKTCMDKLLELGADRKSWQGKEDEHIKQIDATRMMWMKHIKDLGFVYACAEQAIKIAQGKTRVEDARHRLTQDLIAAAGAK